MKKQQLVFSLALALVLALAPASFAQCGAAKAEGAMVCPVTGQSASGATMASADKGECTADKDKCEKTCDKKCDKDCEKKCEKTCDKAKSACSASCGARAISASAGGGEIIPKAAVGTAAPDFKLSSACGNLTTSLSDLRGKIVAVQFYNQACPWITTSRFDTQKLHEKYADKDVVFLYIDCTANHTDEIVKNDASEAGLKLPILMNTTGEVGRAFDAKQTPESFVIDETGIVRYRGAFDNRTQPREAGDVNYVQKAIDDLLNDREVEITHKKAFGCSIKYSV